MTDVLLRPAAKASDSVFAGSADGAADLTEYCAA